MGVKKYFIAIVLKDELLGRAEAIKHELRDLYGLRGALRSPAHITLHRPFEWKEENEDKLIKKLSGFRFDKRFDIFLRGFGFFVPRVIYINVSENELLNELHDLLARYAGKELKLTNESDDMRGFHPHVTVAFRDLRKKKFYELHEKFTDRAFEGSFVYSGFSLLRLVENWKELHFFETNSETG